MYNFEVEDWHTYFVSEQNVLVHNSCSQGGKPRKGESFRGGKKGSRDQWYGYNDKEFQRWWHREGKESLGKAVTKNKLVN